MVNRVIKRKALKSIALFFAVNILADCLYPTVALALTSGPAQPEYTSFEPVATTDMVNEFSGQFTYNLPVINVPGPNGSSYPLSLSYHSGTSAEDEASWVGYGWSLNPGAINRGKQGIPDDVNGDQITYVNDRPKNLTVSATAQATFELFSFDGDGDKKGGGIGLSQTFRYNNYRGFGSKFGISFNLMGGLASMNYSVSGEEGHSFSADLNPAALLTYADKPKIRAANDKLDKHSGTPPSGKNPEAYATKRQEAKNELRKYSAKSQLQGVVGSLSSTYGLSSLGEDMRAVNTGQYSGLSINVGFSMGITPPPLHLGVEFGGAGTFNTQSTNGYVNRNVVGLMYQNQLPNGDMISDYSVEKEAVYNKRDRYLPIPYQSPDMFSITGEGVMGGFTMCNPNILLNGPAHVESVTTIANLRPEFTAGTNFGFLGLTLGAGDHRLSVGRATNGLQLSAGYGNPFFRFSNDLGGNLSYVPDYTDQANDLPSQARVLSVNTIYDPERAVTGISDVCSVGRSSYIGHHTIGEINSTINNGGETYRLKSFTRDDNTLAHIDYSNSDIEDRIGEIYTVNENGNMHVYGLPVFTGSEEMMSYSIAKRQDYEPIIHGMPDNVTKIGEMSSITYPSTYLLTQITTPDYIDRGFDGPTEDDFGGYTKFNYRPVYFMTASNPTAYRNKSSQGDWYRWRFPYTGYVYEKGELSDSRDDMGTVRSGSKEIYYLKDIETKTHIAKFITNEIDDLASPKIQRTDGISAVQNSITAGADENAKDINKRLERLERIELYAKNNLTGKPITTVHFEYYEDGDPAVLLKNLPNSSYSASNKSGGKLTLKRVWFEHEGVVNSKIAPYQFKYEYKDLNAAIQNQALKDKYSEVVDFAKDLIDNPSAQNPDYNVSHLGPWGGNLYNKLNEDRLSKMRPWLYQGVMPTSSDPDFVPYDPAAWQLKQIKLPSGGEILVQYEQNEYLYVQDKQALAMVRLLTGASPDGNVFKINTEDIGLPTTATTLEKQAYLTKLNAYLNTDKIFFRFLYTLMGSSNADINNCASDYLEGYCKAVATINTNGEFVISLLGSDYSKPHDACRSYVTRKKAGLNINPECNSPEINIASNPADAVSAVLGRAVTDIAASTNNCLDLNEEYSYFRVPVYKAKRGGGIRVKRILMYDQGIEQNQEVLYGTEYKYENEDGSSSGVATNEPGAMRDENALIGYLDKRAPQSFLNRVISGVDKENFEGPIGESLLPSPSIGYERVITQNIHTGKTGTGFKISEYNTVHSKNGKYAFKALVSNIDNATPFKLNLPVVIVNILIDNRLSTQGYTFITNNMHGQLTRTAIFGGVYETGKAEIEYHKTFEEIKEFYEPGEKVNILNASGEVNPGYLGKEVKVTVDGRTVNDVLNDGNLQLDFSVGMFGIYPIPQFGLMPYYRYEQRQFKMNVITKQVSYTVLPKRTITTQDGVVNITENKVFSETTGQPVVVSSYDGYDKLSLLSDSNPPHEGSYTNYTIPASYIYTGMGQKRQNQGHKETGVTLAYSGDVYTMTVSEPEKFTKGDLVKLESTLFYVSSKSSNQVTLQKLSVFSDAGAIGSSKEVEVINSGYTNQLNAPAAKVTTYGAENWWNENDQGGINKNKIINNGQLSSSLTNILSVSTTAYNDEWGSSVIDEDYNLTSIENDFETARSGKWRIHSSYAYKSNVKDAVSSGNKVYTEAGVYNSTFSGFDYTNLSVNTSNQWIRTSLTNLYSPNGNMLEEQNALGTKSAAVFGHNENVPVLIAKNAAYGSVKFMSFEDQLLGSGVDGSTAHTGKKSYAITESSPINIPLRLDLNAKQKGLTLKFWAKSTPEVLEDINSNISCEFTDQGSTALIQPKLTKLSQVGEWVLYEAIVRGVKNIAATDFTLKLMHQGQEPLWLDDIRVQPYESEMICYVYDDKTLRLLATLDDQHFAMIYQYNGEGKLIRKIVETERGVKAISETQYNTPKVNY